MSEKAQAIERLAPLRSHPETVVIHYSCESFFDKPDGYSPRISAIVAKDMKSKQTHSFAIHYEAEATHVDKAGIEDQYDGLERKMLDRFFNFVKERKSHFYVHWNMRDANYGFQAIYRRYRALGGVPFEIEENRLIDLADCLVEIHGHDYAGHPRLQKTMEINGLTAKNFLSGKEEAGAFAQKEYNRLHLSTLRKVDAIGNIMNLQLEGELKTNTHPLISKISEIHTHWLLTLIGILLAFYGLGNAIIKAIVWLLKIGS